MTIKTEEIVIFSDLHAHEHQSHAKVLADGVNSRLQDCINAAEEIARYAKRYELELFFAGDLFQVKGMVSVVAETLLKRIFDKYGKCIIAIPGNHDMGSANGKYHALENFSNIISSNEPAIWHNANCIIGLIPFPMENGKFNKEKFNSWLKTTREMVKVREESFSEKPNKILISHVFTHELMKKHHGIDGDISAEELLDGFDCILLGHHHIHDVIVYGDKKVISIGSPLQLTFNDRSDDRGFVILNTKTLSHYFVPLTTPHFMSFDGVGAIIPEKVSGGFVRVKVSSKSEAKIAHAALEKAGASSIIIEIIPSKESSRMGISFDSKDSDIIKGYLESDWIKTDLNKEKLANLGVKYLGD